VAIEPEEAVTLMHNLNQGVSIKILDMTVAFLREKDNVRSDRIGVTGFCMGGTYALLLHCYSKDIAAAAPFYGDIPPMDTLKELSAPILFIGAENDFWITKEKIERLRRGLSDLKKEGKVVVYEGVGHAFFNNTRPEAYDEKSAADAWERVTHFFAEKLRA
jgi:carboxymethylenebutenolidase